MRGVVYIRFIVSLFLIGGLTGCVSLPSELESNNENLIVKYANWEPQTEVGTAVRLGGVIASVENDKNRTRLDIVNLPLTQSGKPNLNYEPHGRFIAYIPGFVDPVMLAKGRLISFLGVTQKTGKTMIGHYQGVFPVMNVIHYHLWKIKEQVVVDHLGFPLRSCNSSYCRDNEYRQGRIIQVVK